MTDIEQERERAAFEAWHQKKYGYPVASVEERLRWEAWQARAQQPSANEALALLDGLQWLLDSYDFVGTGSSQAAKAEEQEVREKWGRLRAMLAAQQPSAADGMIVLSADVREYLKEGIESATQGEDADDDYDFASQLSTLLGPLYARPAADVLADAESALRHASKVVELYDDATTSTADYMLDSADCAGILNALAEYAARAKGGDA